MPLNINKFFRALPLRHKFIYGDIPFIKISDAKAQSLVNLKQIEIAGDTIVSLIGDVHNNDVFIQDIVNLMKGGYIDLAIPLMRGATILEFCKVSRSISNEATLFVGEMYKSPYERYIEAIAQKQQSYWNL